VDNFGHYSAFYGSIGGIIILLIWLYFSAVIILIGGELNAALAYEKPTVNS
jgi:membrane protein